jgi:hypothetical protein
MKYSYLGDCLTAQIYQQQTINKVLNPTCNPPKTKLIGCVINYNSALLSPVISLNETRLLANTSRNIVMTSQKSQ